MKMVRRPVQTFIEYLVTERTYTVIFLLILATAALAVGGKNLYFRGDYKVFFEEGYGPLEDFREMERVFIKNDNVAILLVPSEGNVLDKDMLELVHAYTEEAWKIPYSSRVDSLVNFQNTYSEYDDLVVENLVDDPEMLDEETLARVRKTALSELALHNSILPEDASVTLINVTLQFPDVEDITASVVEVQEYVNNLTEQFRAQYPDVQFYHTGIIPLNYSFALEGQRDVMTLVPAMIVLTIILLTVMLRSFWAMVATMVVLTVSVLATMGLGGWLGYYLSPGTINVPIVILSIGVADCVHMVASMQYGQSRYGMKRKEAIKYALELNWMPIFITSTTTSIGLSTLVLSESPVFADFGVLAAVGVMTAYLFSVTLFPAILCLVPIKVINAEEGKSVFMSQFAEWIIKYQKPLVYIGIPVVLGISYLATHNEVNDVATEYFSDTTDFRKAVMKQEQEMSGMQSVDWALYTDKEGEINSPEFIKLVSDFSDWLRDQPEVDNVRTISDTYKKLNMNMHDDDPEWYAIPESREMAAQYLLLYEMSLPYGLDLNNQINIDKSAARVTAIMGDTGTQEILDFEISSKAWFEENFPGIEMKVASPAIMFSHIGLTNMHSMIKSLFIAILLISGIMMFALKSLRLGAISLIPTLSPALVGFGIWFLISGYLNLGLSIVASMTLGIIVDDCVHFLAKYKRARADGMSTEEAVRYAFVNVGRALVITTVVLSVGFSILLMSAFRLNSDMGLATTIVLITALVIDFLFLPPLLLVLDKDKKPKAAAQ
tara:strand:- start:742 stop:3069 length:2328 start_codon:yes stop_codon:yes gene_type:complete